MAIKRSDFPLPDVDDPSTAPYFAAAARGELTVTRCAACERYVWYPRDACPECGGALTWVTVSGRGELFSWAVVRRPFLPAFEDKVPFVSALVTLAEDDAVRIVTNVVDIAPEALQPGMPLEVTFRPLAFATVPDREVVVPMFRPAPPT